MGQQSRVRGFTLLELLVVAIVLALLAGLLLPMFAKTRETIHPRPCKTHVKQLGLAMAMYSNDFDGFYPTRGLNLTVGRDDLRGLGSLSLLYDQYVTAPKLFKCPQTEDDPFCATVGLNIDSVMGLVTARPGGCSYAYDSQKAGVGRRGLSATDLANVAILADKPDPIDRLRNSPNHGNTGQNVLYFDGHVEWGPTRHVGVNANDIYSASGSANVLSYTDSYVTQ